MEKRYIDANQLLEDSFKLADHILTSGFEPDLLIGIWRGGAPIAVAVQEYFSYRGLSTGHFAIRTSSYKGLGVQNDHVEVHGIRYVIDNIQGHEKLLIVDDIFDTGRSIDALMAELEDKCGDELPSEIKIATVYYKSQSSRSERVPDYYLYETEDWIVFPHEVVGLTNEEIKLNKPRAVAEILTEQRE